MSASKDRDGLGYLVVGVSMLSVTFFLALTTFFHPLLIQRFSGFIGDFFKGVFPGDYKYILYFLLYFLLPLIFLVLILAGGKFTKLGVKKWRRSALKEKKRRSVPKTPKKTSAPKRKSKKELATQTPPPPDEPPKTPSEKSSSELEEPSSPEHEEEEKSVEKAELPEEEIEERKETETSQIDKETAVKELNQLKGVFGSTAENLYEAGYHSIDDVKKASKKDLMKIDGIGLALSEMILDSIDKEEEEKENEE